MHKSLAFSLSVLLCVAMGTSASAQGTDSDKQAAMERYLKVVPISKMMDDTYAQIARQLPPERRAQFIAELQSLITAERVEQIARSAMLKTFSTDEFNALADFYTSRHGASAMAKFGAYMGEVMPPLMQEVQRAMQELQSRSKK